MEIKPCPFCGSTKIKYSLKTGGQEYSHSLNDFTVSTVYYSSMYCDTCHTYGPRVRTVFEKTPNRTTIERDEILKQNALDAWNKRN